MYICGKNIIAITLKNNWQLYYHIGARFKYIYNTAPVIYIFRGRSISFLFFKKKHSPPPTKNQMVIPYATIGMQKI